MSGELRAALWAESLKVRRSRVPLVTLAAMLLAGLVSGFFMFVLQDVDRARSLGLLGTKAQLAGETADWAGYFAMAAQITSVGGLVIFGVAAIWLFGREFSDRTAKDLLALPTARTPIVLAKLVVGLLWCLGLVGFLLVVVLAFGGLLGLPGWSEAVALRGTGTVVVAGALTAGLASTYGLAASVGRGYLPAVGVMFLTVLAAQVVSAVGYGAWFPWAVPSLIAGAGGAGQVRPGGIGVAAVMAVVLVAVAVACAWWERADHNR